MQLPNEWLHGIIGALVALAATKWLGWLNLPFLGAGASSEARRQPVLYQQPADLLPSPPQQSYSTMINIPHRITVTPERVSQ